jgi:hypothetical protein
MIIESISLLRPVLDKTVVARNASIARRQGLNPARRPAIRTVSAVDNVMLSKSSDGYGVSEEAFVRTLPSRADIISSLSLLSFPS